MAGWTLGRMENESMTLWFKHWALGCMENESMTLWFEHSSGTEENGGNCYLELSPCGTMVALIDADGTACLPKPVITMLRRAGVFVDSTFE
jgi:hypothetical protein